MDKSNTGPKPKHLKIDGDWGDAMGKVIRKKKKPKEGWPEPEKKKDKDKAK